MSFQPSGSHSERMFKTSDVVEVDFQAWPKTPRLFKDCTVTEKIDGTNACVIIAEHPLSSLGEHCKHALVIPAATHAGDSDMAYMVGAQSRKRIITPDADNYGFAAWVHENAETLVSALGVGRHYGEWWGRGIQRGYGADKRTFSLFNVDKWGDWRGANDWERIGLSVVPRLYVGPFDTAEVAGALLALADTGSVAAPGFEDPEGVCVFHHASRTVFKALLDGDQPKGSPRDLHGNVIPLTRADASRPLPAAVVAA